MIALKKLLVGILCSLKKHLLEFPSGLILVVNPTGIHEDTTAKPPVRNRCLGHVYTQETVCLSAGKFRRSVEIKQAV